MINYTLIGFLALLMSLAALAVGSCLVWLVDDIPSLYYAVGGTLLNHTDCRQGLVTGWFVPDYATMADDSNYTSSGSIVTIDYSWTLCGAASPWLLPDCCHTEIGLTNWFWIVLLKEGGNGTGFGLSHRYWRGEITRRPYLPSQSRTSWRAIGWIIFALSCIALFTLLLLVVGNSNRARSNLLSSTIRV